MANKSNTPNIPSNSSKNVPPAVPQNKKQVPNIPGDVATNPIIPDLSEVGTDDNKWLLVTGDFSKDNNLISWIEKKDIKSHSTSLETCTLLSLTRKIQELKRGDYNTYIALLPPDKPELIYLYGGTRRYDLYYYTFDFVYRLRDLEVDEWKEAAFNYFSKSLLPDFTDSDFIESGKTKEIHERWEGKFSEEFLNKVLKNIYLFVSPEETEYKIFRFLDNMLDSDDDNIDLDIDDLVDKDDIKENLDALVKDGLELSDSQEAILEEIANDMLQILKQSQKKNVQQDFAEIHERWDDKLPKEFIVKVLENINLFVSPEEIEFKIFRYLEMMLNKDEIEFDGIERKIKKRLDALVKEGLELTDSQEAILDEIANDMLQILKQSPQKDVQQDFAEIHERWDGKLPKEFINKVLKNINLFVSLEETEYKIFQFLDNMLDSNDDNIDLDIDDLVDEDEIKENLDALVKDGLELSDSQEAILEEIANDMLQILKQSQKKNVQQDFAEIHERWDDKLPKEFIVKVLENINLFVSPEEIEFKIFRYLEMMLNKDEIEFDGIERKIKKRLDALVKEGLELTDSQEAILDEIANDMLQILKQSPQKDVQQDFTEIHERWDDKLPKEFIDKVLNNVSPYCSIEETEYKIFRFLDNWLNSDDDIIDIDDFHNADDLRKFKKLKLEELSLARAERDSSQEARNKWKSILNDLHDIDTALRHGANSIDDLKIALAIKHNVSLSQELDYFLVNKDKIESDVIERKIKNRLNFLLKRVLHLPVSKESVDILDEMVNDMLQPLVKHFVKVKSEKKRKQQVIKTKADNNRKQQTITAQKNADTEAKTKRNVEAEAKKAETEARKAEATLKRKQIEAEEDALEEIKGKRRKWGCISIIAVIFIYSFLPSSIKSCQEENISENLANTEDIEAKLKTQFDCVYKHDNYYEIEKDSKYGFADLKGNIKISPQYDYVGLYYNDYRVVAVTRDEKYGLVSLKTFTEILEPTYDFIGVCDSETGFLRVRNGKFGLFSLKEMKEVTPCIYDNISFEFTHYLVTKDRKLGFLNLDGSYRGPLK